MKPRTSLSYALLEERYQPIVQELQRAFGKQLKTVVLFGSQVRGDAREDSDHDLFVVVEGLPREPLARLRTVRSTLQPILHQLPGSIGFVAKTPEEVASNLTPLLLDVCIEGLCLYGESYLEPYRQKALIALERSGLRQRKVRGERVWVFPQIPSANWELSWEGYREGQ